MNAELIVSELSSAQRPALERHFLALGAEDRRLRFGIALSDAAVRAYVARIDFGRDAAFAVLDDELEPVGVAHLARDRDSAELGVSVRAGERGRGIGGALLARAHTRARNWGVRTLFMHCLRENAAMMHLARKQGMDIASQAGEADAHLTLAPADAATHFGEVFAQRVALFDYALKAQLLNTRRMAGVLATRGTASPVRER
jgi:RimJ/RimL family protein N-acetyltransferase